MEEVPSIGVYRTGKYHYAQVKYRGRTRNCPHNHRTQQTARTCGEKLARRWMK